MSSVVYAQNIDSSKTAKNEDLPTLNSTLTPSTQPPLLKIKSAKAHHHSQNHANQ